MQKNHRLLDYNWRTPFMHKVKLDSMIENTDT